MNVSLIFALSLGKTHVELCWTYKDTFFTHKQKLKQKKKKLQYDTMPGIFVWTEWEEYGANS